MSVAFNPVRSQMHAAHLARIDRLNRPRVAIPPAAKQAKAGPVAVPPADSPPLLFRPLEPDELPHARLWLLKRLGPNRPARWYLEIVAFWHGVSVDDMLGHRRYAELNRARLDAVAALAKAKPHYSLLRIGRIMNRDHTSILSSMYRLGLRSPRSASSEPGERG